MLDWPAYLKTLTSLIAITNPIGAIPIFVSLTQGMTTKDRHRTIRITSMTYFVVMGIVMFAGEPLLEFFGISLASFRVGGGILIIMMALNMMQAKHPKVKSTAEEHQEAVSKESIAVVPLAIPLLSGPGAISTMILNVNQNPEVSHRFFLLLAALFTAVIIFVVLSFAPRLANYLGKTGINIVTRIMGLIMIAIGVEFISTGMLNLFPGLK